MARVGLHNHSLGEEDWLEDAADHLPPQILLGTIANPVAALTVIVQC